MHRRALSFAALLLLAMSGCDWLAPSNHTEARLGKAFWIDYQERVQIPVKGPDLIVLFDEIEDDSRCPSQVDCIWAGEAKIWLGLMREGQVARGYPLVKLTIPGTLDEPCELCEPVPLEGYRFTLLQLEPYPERDYASHDAYRALVRIEQAEDN